MTQRVDFNKYQNFVDAVTSDASKDFLALSDRMVQLDEKGANIERLLTASVGINAEGGEFLEIVMKIKKPAKKCSNCVHDTRHNLHGTPWIHCQLCCDDKTHTYSGIPQYECTTRGYSKHVWDGSTK